MHLHVCAVRDVLALNRVACELCNHHSSFLQQKLHYVPQLLFSSQSASYHTGWSSSNHHDSILILDHIQSFICHHFHRIRFPCSLSYHFSSSIFVSEAHRFKILKKGSHTYRNMEYELHDSKKRVREGDEEHMNKSEKHAKTKDDDLSDIFDFKSEVFGYNCNHGGGSSLSVNGSLKTSSSSSDSHDYCDLALGVFDFPWLKDGGVISKSDQEYWNFEDVFSSPLEYDLIHTPTLSTTSAGGHIEFSNFSWQCFYDETDPDKKVEFQEDKPELEEDVCRAPS